MNIPAARRVARLSSRGGVVIGEAPLPEPAPGELVVRVARSVVSAGTELTLQKPSLERPETLREFGYQNAGIVADANGCVGFKEGDRVGCMGANYALHSDWVVVPQHLTFKIDDQLSFEQAAFANLLGTAVHAIRRGHVEFGQHVAVVGLGIVGQLIVQVSALCGAHPIAIDRVAMRREISMQMGARAAVQFAEVPNEVEQWKRQHTRGYGLDVGFVAFGGDASAVVGHLARAMKQAPDTHAYGHIVIVGNASINAGFPVEFGNIDVCASSRTGPGYHDDLWERGGRYPEALVPWNTRRNVEECFEFIVAKKLQVEPLITHRVELEELPEACRKLVQQPELALAVVVKYE